METLTESNELYRMEKYIPFKRKEYKIEWELKCTDDENWPTYYWVAKIVEI